MSARAIHKYVGVEAVLLYRMSTLVSQVPGIEYLQYLQYCRFYIHSRKRSTAAAGGVVRRDERAHSHKNHLSSNSWGIAAAVYLVVVRRAPDTINRILVSYTSSSPALAINLLHPIRTYRTSRPAQATFYEALCTRFELDSYIEPKFGETLIPERHGYHHRTITTWSWWTTSLDYLSVQVQHP